MQRLSEERLAKQPPSVRRPQYDRTSLQIGMAHIGVGAFHRCHQAEYTDDMLEAKFGRWGVLGVNLKPPRLADLLGPQDCLFSRTLRQDERAEDHKATLARLMFRSMTEDGEFARSYLRQVPSHLAGKIARCIQAAIDAGEVVDTPIAPDLAGWLTHHLAIMLMLNHLATPPNLDYGMPRAALVRQAVLFALRGIGIKEKVIRRYYHPEEWVKPGR